MCHDVTFAPVGTASNRMVYKRTPSVSCKRGGDSREKSRGRKSFSKVICSEIVRENWLEKLHEIFFSHLYLPESLQLPLLLVRFTFKKTILSWQVSQKANIRKIRVFSFFFSFSFSSLCQLFSKAWKICQFMAKERFCGQ